MDKSKIAVDIFNKRAQLYQDKFMNVGMYHRSFDLFCEHIPQHAEVLEIACGPGNITQYLLKKRPDLTLLGTDLAPNMLELARINNPGTQFQLMDAREIGKMEKKYDAILCGFCMPYLSKEEVIKWIVDAAGVLKTKGAVYISTMEDDYSKSDFKTGSAGDQLYIHYHLADYIVKALSENGFTLIDLERQAFPEQDGTSTTDLLIIAQKTE
jgi:ubiquinone/menaquinone biosynthesis C-methylase UbiE